VAPHDGADESGAPLDRGDGTPRVSAAEFPAGAEASPPALDNAKTK